jgi:hypothetical protein
MADHLGQELFVAGGRRPRRTSVPERGERCQGKPKDDDRHSQPVGQDSHSVSFHNDAVGASAAARPNDGRERGEWYS